MAVSGMPFGAPFSKAAGLSGGFFVCAPLSIRTEAACRKTGIQRFQGCPKLSRFDIVTLSIMQLTIASSMHVAPRGQIVNTAFIPVLRCT
jgi:hypothetical protein